MKGLEEGEIHFEKPEKAGLLGLFVDRQVVGTEEQVWRYLKWRNAFLESEE
jgi:hypothetical protein